MGDLSAASNPCSASRAVSAMPPRPVPPNLRKSLRLSSQRPAWAKEDWVFIGFRADRVDSVLVRVGQPRAESKRPELKVAGAGGKDVLGQAKLLDCACLFWRFSFS